MSTDSPTNAPTHVVAGTIVQGRIATTEGTWAKYVPPTTRIKRDVFAWLTVAASAITVALFFGYIILKNNGELDLDAFETPDPDTIFSQFVYGPSYGFFAVVAACAAVSLGAVAWALHQHVREDAKRQAGL